MSVYANHTSCYHTGSFVGAYKELGIHECFSHLTVITGAILEIDDILFFQIFQILLFVLFCACVCLSMLAWAVFANAIGTNTMPLEDPEGDGRGILFLFLSSIINLFLNYIDDLKIFLHRTLVNIVWIRQKFQSLKS